MPGLLNMLVDECGLGLLDEDDRPLPKLKDELEEWELDEWELGERELPKDREELE